MEAGTIVYLKSGGPPMVLQAAVGELALVRWFGGFNNQDIKSEVFPLAALIERDPSARVPTMLPGGQMGQGQVSASTLSLVPKDPA